MLSKRDVLFCVGLSVMGADAGAQVAARGAGATFPAPVYRRWSEAWKARSGEAIAYDAVGSGAGVERIRTREVDFGGTDDPLGVAQLQSGLLVQFPVVIGGVVPVVHVPGLPRGELRLDGPTLAALYQGRVTRWDDPAVVALNPHLPLPGLAVAPVHRSDSSGTSFLFTTYLSLASEEWRQAVGAGKRVEWPAGRGCEGNDGVALCVGETPGAVGYVEYSRVRGALSPVRLLNREGRYVAPDPAAFQAASRALPWEHVPAFSAQPIDQPGLESWPITGASFVVMPLAPPDPARARAVLRFFAWALDEGAGVAESLGYVPLPPDLVRVVNAAWGRQLRLSDGTPLWREGVAAGRASRD